MRRCIRQDSSWVGLVLAAVLMTGFGCGSRPGRVADDAAIVDAAADAGPVIPPLRRLQHRGLLGSAPVNNRVFDPTWQVLDGLIWNPQHPLTGEIAQVTRQVQRTPQGQPALRLQPAMGDSSAQVVGLAKGGQGPLLASVWIGRLEGVNVASVSASVYGLFDYGAGAVELEADPTQTVVMDGVTWVRLAAVLEQGAIGTVYLRLVNQAVEPAFFSSPVVQRSGGQTRRAVGARAPGVRRPMLPAEAASIREFIRRSGERFGGPPRSVEARGY